MKKRKTHDHEMARKLTTPAEVVEFLEIPSLELEQIGFRPADFTEDELVQFRDEGFLEFAQKRADQFTESDLLKAILFQFRSADLTAELARQLVDECEKGKSRWEMILKQTSAGPVAAFRFPRRQAGRARSIAEPTVEQCQAYAAKQHELKDTDLIWKRICSDYKDDPGGNWRKLAASSAPSSLLNYIQKKGLAKLTHFQLAQYHLATESGLDIYHTKGTHQGELVSSSTLKRWRQRGMAAKSPKKPSKRISKADFSIVKN